MRDYHVQNVEILFSGGLTRLEERNIFNSVYAVFTLAGFWPLPRRQNWTPRVIMGNCCIPDEISTWTKARHARYCWETAILTQAKQSELRTSNQILQDLGKRYSTVNVVLNGDLPFKNCLTDRLIQISMIFAILFAKWLQFWSTGHH